MTAAEAAMRRHQPHVAANWPPGPSTPRKSTWTLRDTAAGKVAAGQEPAGPDIPSALEAYRALRADGGENGKQIKSVLERLRADPGKVRGESLRYRPDAWMIVVEMAANQPGGSSGVSPSPAWLTLCGSARNQVLTRGPTLRKRHDLNRHAFFARPPGTPADPRARVRPGWSSSAQTVSHRRGAQAVSSLDRPAACGDPASCPAADPPGCLAATASYRSRPMPRRPAARPLVPTNVTVGVITLTGLGH